MDRVSVIKKFRILRLWIINVIVWGSAGHSWQSHVELLSYRLVTHFFFFVDMLVDLHAHSRSKNQLLYFLKEGR